MARSPTTLWPTRLVERIREPIDVFAHRWTLEGLDVDRDLGGDEIGAGSLSDLVTDPALPLVPSLELLF